MTDEQVKAAKSLKRALVKCQKANLKVAAWADGGMFAIPLEVAREMPDGEDNETFWDWHEENAMQVNPPELAFDGGAGV